MSYESCHICDADTTNGHPFNACAAGPWPDMRLSMRDYFAAQAIPVLIQGMGWEDIHRIAKRAYKVADAMLLEREGSAKIKR